MDYGPNDEINLGVGDTRGLFTTGRILQETVHAARRCNRLARAYGQRFFQSGSNAIVGGPALLAQGLFSPFSELIQRRLRQRPRRQQSCAQKMRTTSSSSFSLSPLQKNGVCRPLTASARPQSKLLYYAPDLSFVLYRE